MKLPAVALRNLVVLPKMLLHFDISRPKSVAAVERAMVGDQKLFLVCQKDEKVNDPGLDDLCAYGTVCEVRQLIRLPNNLIRVLVEGETRAELIDLLPEPRFLQAEVEAAPFVNDVRDANENEALFRLLREAVETYAEQVPGAGDTILRHLMPIETLPEFVAQAAVRINLPAASRQQLLDASSTYMRARILLNQLETEIDIASMKNDINSKVKKRLDTNQREYVLREQMRTIKEALGEDEKSDAAQFEEQCEKLVASDEVKNKIRKEIRRFSMIPSGSQEGTVSRTYIETLLELPWDKMEVEDTDIKRAKKILDEDHYGMEKIKERILEYLAVRKFTGEAGGSILCLVGPPGTGKTSVARSVARALDKKYVRVSLGGVRDEAEIRGHRRTYIGAMPGRIAVGLKQAGVANPLMLLDEVDKVSSDYKGDTSSALLEVLDSEQNMHFQDHYVELPIDLSHVLFIATANTTETIPRPLLDRMELIELSSYTENEKLHIAKDFLVAKQLKKNGLNGEMLQFSDGALKKIIHNYTREAGVRNLERRIGDICRKSARDILEHGHARVRVTEKNVEKYLGREFFTFNDETFEPQVGVVRGLAWTSVGGDTLQIEVNVMPGTGKLQLTGKLGDVMQESARAGITYIRSVGETYGIAADYFDTHDLHLHIPEGAVPKDGPSAGITMATAVLSAVTGRRVDGRVAMTGEITLRGRVLPVGGLKEKLLAAKMAGMKKVLVPAKNRAEIETLSKEITGGMELRFVSCMEEVIAESFVEQPEAKTAKKRKKAAPKAGDADEQGAGR